MEEIEPGDLTLVEKRGLGFEHPSFPVSDVLIRGRAEPIGCVELPRRIFAECLHHPIAHPAGPNRGQDQRLLDESGYD